MRAPRKPGQPGFVATWRDTCLICDRPIAPGQLIVRRKNGYIHTRCAPGADD